MKITISSEGIEHNKLTVGEALTLMLVTNKVDYETETKNLVNKNLITKNGGLLDYYKPTSEASLLLQKIYIDSEKLKPSDKSEFTDVAIKIKSIYPKGAKLISAFGGKVAKFSWTDSVPLIELRLKTFMKKYGPFILSNYNGFTYDWIIDATQNYVDSFGNDKKFMKLLKYFIFEEKNGAGGDRESTSPLLNELEKLFKKSQGDNEESSENNSNNWLDEFK